MPLDNIAEWTELLKNILPFVVLLYYIVTTIRNWNGNPELKILKIELKLLHQELSVLIKNLGD